jgi:tetratricopeptide (TPR) repeat protein
MAQPPSAGSCETGHLTADQLALAADRQVPAWALAVRLLTHLREVCPECAAAMAATEGARRGKGLVALLFGARAPAAQARASVRATASLAWRPPLNPAENHQAARAVVALWTTPVAQRRGRLAAEPRLCTLEVWELLIARSLASPPQAAEALARLAWLVAASLDRQELPELLRGACRVEALAVLARARIRRARHSRARAALRLAQRLVAEGAVEPYAVAEVRLAQADLARAEGRSAEAVRHLGQAARVYGEVEDGHREGAARIQQGLLLDELGKPGEAAAALARGLALLDARGDPELADAAGVALWTLLPRCEATGGGESNA